MRGLWEGVSSRAFPAFCALQGWLGGHRAVSREQGADLEGSLGGPGAPPPSTGCAPPDAPLPAGADKGRWPRTDNMGEGERGELRKLFQPSFRWVRRRLAGVSDRGVPGALFHRPLRFGVNLTRSTLYGEKGDAESFLWKA